ncbi:Hypothetical_protein [Hexamita inflata]|uniref:Hypothetical_protein n=1 Tax=Hexamita inflata TaxID=28002 RepID=A0AA86UB25_9EUKA|nr:Hypothetical protein HINF_LOCUS38325 [Hexamita inflata]
MQFQYISYAKLICLRNLCVSHTHVKTNFCVSCVPYNNPTSERPQASFCQALFLRYSSQVQLSNLLQSFFLIFRLGFGIVCLLSDLLVISCFFLVSLNLRITAAAVSNQLYNSLYNLVIFSLRDQIFLSLLLLFSLCFVGFFKVFLSWLCGHFFDWRLCGLHHSFFVKVIKDFPVVVSAFELNITVRQGGKAVGTGFLYIDLAMFFAPLDYFLSIHKLGVFERYLSCSQSLHKLSRNQLGVLPRILSTFNEW